MWRHTGQVDIKYFTWYNTLNAVFVVAAKERTRINYVMHGNQNLKISKNLPIFLIIIFLNMVISMGFDCIVLCIVNYSFFCVMQSILNLHFRCITSLSKWKKNQRFCAISEEIDRDINYIYNKKSDIRISDNWIKN